MCHQRHWKETERERKKKKSPSIHQPPLTAPPFYLARALKNNHPGHAPLLPIISPIYPHLSLCFPFLLSVFLPSHLSLIVFVCSCPCHCFALAVFLFLPLLSPVQPSLVSLSRVSLSLVHSVFRPVFSSTWQKHTEPFSQVSAQSSLSNSFILSTNNPFNSSRLICVYPPTPPLTPNTRTFAHPPIIYN